MNHNACNLTARPWWYEADPLTGEWNSLLEAFAPFTEVYRDKTQFSLSEKDGTFRVTALLPGCEAGQITVEVLGDFLTVKVPEKTEELAEGERYLCRERRRGELNRTVKLPGRVDASRVTASFKDGILTVTLPREIHAGPVAVKVAEAV